MLTLIFITLMIVVFGNLIVFALKAAWGIAKVLIAIVFFPICLIALFCTGAVALALPILIIAGLLTLIRSAIA